MADIENRAYMKLTYMDRILLALMTEDKDKLFIPPMAIGCYFNISTRYVMQRYQSVIKYLERKSVTAGEYREFVSGLARISGLYVPNDLVKAITSLKKKHISIDSQITKSTMDQYSVVIRWITSKIPIVDVSDY